MANLAGLDVLRIRMVTVASDQIGVNTLHYVVNNLIGTVTDVEAADDIDFALGTPYRSCMSDDATYRGLSVQRIFPGTLTVPVINTDSQGAGAIASEILPRQVSALIGWRTVYAGPRFRGRTYLPFPPESASEPPGVPTAAYQATLQAFADAHLAGIGVTGAGGSCTLTPVLWHRDLANWSAISAGFARPAWATQKRRGSYGQQNVVPF